MLDKAASPINSKRNQVTGSVNKWTKKNIHEINKKKQKCNGPKHLWKPTSPRTVQKEDQARALHILPLFRSSLLYVMQAR